MTIGEEGESMANGHKELLEYEGYGKAMYEGIVKETTFIAGQYTNNKQYVSDSIDEIKDYADFWWDENNSFFTNYEDYGLFENMAEMGGGYLLTAGDWVKRLFNDYDKQDEISQPEKEKVIDFSPYYSFITFTSGSGMRVVKGYSLELYRGGELLTTLIDSYSWAVIIQANPYTGVINFGSSGGGLSEITRSPVPYKSIYDYAELQFSRDGQLQMLYDMELTLKIKKGNEDVNVSPIMPNVRPAQTINKYIQNGGLDDKKLVVPEPRPYLSCPDGTKIQMSISGSTFLSADGEVLLVNKDGTAIIEGISCNLSWEVPDMKYIDDIPVIKDKEDKWIDMNNGLPVAIGKEGETMENGIFAGGSGTIDDPFLIKDSTGIMYIDKQPSAYYKLVNDIDFKDVHGWSGLEMGNDTAFDNYETIGIDGDGHTIKNLTITPLMTGAWDGKAMGFIRQSYPSLKIHNLNVLDYKVDCLDNDPSDHSSVGFIGECYDLTMTNCHFKNMTIPGTSWATGGIIGSCYLLYDMQLISRCSVDNLTIIGASEMEYAGGIIGFAEEVTLDQCEVRNSHIEMGATAGGLMATGSSNIIVSNCNVHNTTLKTTRLPTGRQPDNNMGGLIAVYTLYDTSELMRISNSYFHGVLEIPSGDFENGDYDITMVGGLVGHFEFRSEPLPGNNFIKNSYVLASAKVGSVESVLPTQYGEMVGVFNWNDETIELENNYKLSTFSDTSMQTVGNITDEEAKMRLTYENNGWNFEDIWLIDEGKSYPYLFSIFKIDEQPRIKCNSVNLTD